ncbi:MAG: DUF3096 domain-containing protein [Candidatus Pacearchaeota archaeon]
MPFTTFAISAAAISIIFGLLVLAFPRFLRYFVGGYFIIMGILKLL